MLPLLNCPDSVNDMFTADAIIVRARRKYLLEQEHSLAFEKVTTMFSTLRLAALARAAIVAAALLSSAALAGCAQPSDDGTYYLGENEQVPAALCAAWAAC
ncbi:MAG TPA: hypothetical protein VJ747_16555 [Stellaceae bacterium]|nr:hypothetical protein [Stellaceae bacterium]